MAFRQPTYHAPPRIHTQRQDESQDLLQPNIQERPAEESQEWVLFSPAAPSFTNGTYTTSTGRTTTAGHSRVSDFGSLDTAARSYGVSNGEDGQTEEGDGEEDGELDSLDSHLHEFRTEPSVYRQEDGKEEGRPVLPTHDGLGSFRVDRGMGEDVQQHLYAFEMYNPRRVKRRRESLEIGDMALENERMAEMERTRRIEQWRMEQSRILVDEIQKETRRRKQSMSSEKRIIIEDKEQEGVATFDNVLEAPVPAQPDSLWNRLTRRVIRDLMGIDDDLLSIIFGEALPSDEDTQTAPRIPTLINTAAQPDKSSWEYRLLERIARELGLLVNQLSDHPGAFTTYLQTQHTPLPYAGLPVIPESARDIPQPSTHEEEDQEPLTSTLNTSPEFHPTITQPVPIPAPPSTSALDDDNEFTPRQSPTITREEWERDLDIKMVFRYLRSRFSSTPPPPVTTNTTTTNISTSTSKPKPSNLATSNTPDSLARAARVRAHHPLIRHNHTHNERRERRRSFRSRDIEIRLGRRGSFESGGVGVGLGLGVVGGGIKGFREGATTGSSRHYWDLGNSVGTRSVGSGSLVVGGGGMGSWGEV